MPGQRVRRVGAVLFDGFELLDVYGPLEIWNALTGWFEVVTLGEKAGPVSPSRGPNTPPGGPQTLVARALAEAEGIDLLLVPGGFGTRREVGNPALLEGLRALAQGAEYVASVCTGSALLAAAGLLDGRRATSNKANLEWVRSQGPKVDWVARARWVVDGNFWTSSGVSAGIDMALALVADIAGEPLARRVARGAEYQWNADPWRDPFAAGGDG